MFLKDFYLTPRGDLAISNISTDSNKMEINFITSFSNALCLNFFIDDTQQKALTASSLQINFHIDKPVYNKEVIVISDNEYMQQAIKIRLASALGSIRGNQDIGSTLEELVHELIDNNSLANSLKASITNAIKDIIPNPTIIINKTKSKYVDYSAGLNILIIDDDKQYTIAL